MGNIQRLGEFQWGGEKKNLTLVLRGCAWSWIKYSLHASLATSDMINHRRPPSLLSLRPSLKSFPWRLRGPGDRGWTERRRWEIWGLTSRRIQWSIHHTRRSAFKMNFGREESMAFEVCIFISRASSWNGKWGFSNVSFFHLQVNQRFPRLFLIHIYIYADHWCGI